MLKEMLKWFALRGIHYSSNYAKLNALYLMADPWNMASPIQQYRFAETKRLILQKLGRPKSLLEIGCGEGHQSLHLQTICDHLTGVDVSAMAVMRARKRCPGCDFIVGDIFSHQLDVLAPFDLVVACEVLYYMKNVAETLRRMRRLGQRNFATYIARDMEALDPQTLSQPGAISEILEFEHSRWRAVWWRGE